MCNLRVGPVDQGSALGSCGFAPVKHGASDAESISYCSTAIDQAPLKPKKESVSQVKQSGGACVV